jgi:hypothetical protein
MHPNLTNVACPQVGIRTQYWTVDSCEFCDITYIERAHLNWCRPIPSPAVLVAGVCRRGQIRAHNSGSAVGNVCLQGARQPLATVGGGRWRLHERRRSRCNGAAGLDRARAVQKECVASMMASCGHICTHWLFGLTNKCCCRGYRVDAG